jgi:hypothetical protein
MSVLPLAAALKTMVRPRESAALGSPEACGEVGLGDSIQVSPHSGLELGTAADDALGEVVVTACGRRALARALCMPICGALVALILTNFCLLCPLACASDNRSQLSCDVYAMLSNE